MLSCFRDWSEDLRCGHRSCALTLIVEVCGSDGHLACAPHVVFPTRPAQSSSGVWVDWQAAQVKLDSLDLFHWVRIRSASSARPMSVTSVFCRVRGDAGRLTGLHLSLLSPSWLASLYEFQNALYSLSRGRVDCRVWEKNKKQRCASVGQTFVSQWRGPAKLSLSSIRQKGRSCFLLGLAQHVYLLLSVRFFTDQGNSFCPICF